MDSIQEILSPLLQQQHIIYELENKLHEKTKNGHYHESKATNTDHPPPHSLSTQLSINYHLHLLGPSLIDHTSISTYQHDIQQYDYQVYHLIGIIQQSAYTDYLKLPVSDKPEHQQTYHTPFTHHTLKLLSLLYNDITPHCQSSAYHSFTTTQIYTHLLSIYAHLQQRVCGINKSDIQSYMIVIHDLNTIIHYTQQHAPPPRNECSHDGSKDRTNSHLSFIQPVCQILYTIQQRCIHVVTDWFTTEWCTIIEQSKYKYIQQNMPSSPPPPHDHHSSQQKHPPNHPDQSTWFHHMSQDIQQHHDIEHISSTHHHQYSPLLKMLYAYIKPLIDMCIIHLNETTSHMDENMMIENDKNNENTDDKKRYPNLLIDKFLPYIVSSICDTYCHYLLGYDHTKHGKDPKHTIPKINKQGALQWRYELDAIMQWLSTTQMSPTFDHTFHTMIGPKNQISMKPAKVKVEECITSEHTCIQHAVHQFHHIYSYLYLLLYAESFIDTHVSSSKGFQWNDGIHHTVSSLFCISTHPSSGEQPHHHHHHPQQQVGRIKHSNRIQPAPSAEKQELIQWIQHHMIPNWQWVLKERYSKKYGEYFDSTKIDEKMLF